MMDDVNEYRDSQITIMKNGLDEREENAFQLDTGEDTVKVWQSNNNIKVRVSGGSVQTLTGDSLTIDPADETLRGADGTTINVAFGDSLSVTNGNHAYGHYELVSDGDMPALAGDTTLADGESFVSVNDIVYSADLEVTYESGDTTVTSRMYLEPEVTESTDN
jgi:hypothetical protein